MILALYNNRYKFCNDICNDLVTVNRYPIVRNEEASQKQDGP
jgi:hypothetical protein